MSDFITLMRPVGGQAVAKSLTESGVKPAQQFKFFKGGHLPVSSLDELAALLDRASKEPCWFLVRGSIKPEADRHNMRRVHKGPEATLAAASHRWLLLDLDSWLPDVQDFAARPATYAAQAREALPEPFHGAAAWWQATGSAGIKPGVRLRLAFWLDRPLSDAEAKTWASSWPVPVDKALYTPSQPHYVANPLLDGVPDPVQGPRSGLLPGHPEVPVPAVLPVATTQADPFQAKDALDRAVRRIKKARPGERNTTLNSVAFSLAARYPEEALPSAELADTLLRATTESGDPLPGDEAYRTVLASIQAGRDRRGQEREGWRGQLLRDLKTDTVRATAANVSLYLTWHEIWDGALAWNERELAPTWVRPPPWGGEVPRNFVDSDITRIVEWFSTQAHLDVRPGWVKAGVVKASQQIAFDPVQMYLKGLPQWDGKSRLDTLFIRHLGVEDTPLVRAQSRAWMIQAVRRAFSTLADPVQADYLIVLSGPQGLRKSGLCRGLCPLPTFFREDLPNVTHKDSKVAVVKSWIVELSELTHLMHREAFKAFITCRVDQFRPPYGECEVSIPRRTVLIGTTNKKEILDDPSGNRRFWTFLCTRRANVKEVAVERDQIWSEAMARAEAGEKAYLSDEFEALADEAREEHRERDPFEERLPLALFKRQEGFNLETFPGQLDESRRLKYVTASQAADVVGQNGSDKRIVGRMKDSLKALGWTEARVRLAGRAAKEKAGQRVRAWFPPDGWHDNYMDSLEVN